MLVIFNEWMTFALLLLGVWGVIYALKPLLRREMLVMGFFTMPFGLLEPLFVPAYWNPPSLFNLAARTGFDVEALIFCFAVGGIASTTYEAVCDARHKAEEKLDLKLPWPTILLVPAAVFLLMNFLTNANPIYSASIALLSGGLVTVLRRHDLENAVILNGTVFAVIYFVYFLLFTLAYPGMVEQVWNLAAISGILVLGVPLEEIMFAFALGTMWAGLYEQYMHVRLVSNARIPVCK